MKQIAEAINTVGTTSGSIAKTELLRKFANIPGFKEVLQFIFDPYIITGIADKKLSNKEHVNSNIYTYNEMIEYYKKNGTGSDIDVSIAWSFINSQETELARELAKSMITKSLKIGVTSTTLNKVFGKSFISKFDIMLGKPYNDYKDKVKGPFIVTEKLDGHRRVLVKENGKGTLFTRSGIVDEGLINIEAEIQYLPDNTVFDGECLAIGEFANALELRQATNSIMNRDGVRTGVTYNIFDSLPLKDFKNGLSIESARSRKIMTGAIFKDYSILKLAMGPIEANNLSALLDKYDHKFSFIKSVPIMGLAYTEDEILVYANEIWAKKFEGVMALQSDSKYETKRSPNLLKVKTTDSYDLPIVDTVEGTGKFAGMLGSFIVEYKGYRVGVGSGLTDSERVKYWAGREGLVGVKIEIDTFGETKNKDGSISLNCPIYKGVRHDKTVV